MSRSDARTKLTGEAVYGTDLFEKGMLFGALVPAPVARGQVLRLDLTPARRMPGVVAVVGPAEVAELLPQGKGDPERPVFPSGSIAYRNQPLAAVAAETLEEARAAARAVRVEVKEEPPVSDLESVFPEWPGEATRKSPDVIAHVLARSGDLKAAFRGADLVHSETYRTSGVHQMAIEPHACLARVTESVWHVRTTTQTPFGAREDAAEILGLPQEKVVVEGTWVGGGFGGKNASFLETYALVLAAASGRPVKLALSYREEFLLGRTTLPAVIRLDTSVRKGRITGRRARLLIDSGSSLPGRDFATGFALAFLVGPYRVGTFEMEGFAVRTNKPPFGPHRAPLAPQCAFAVDSHMDSLARRIGVDPVEFRLAHVWREGDSTTLGQTVGPFGLAEGLEQARRLRDAWRAEAPADHGLGVGCGFWSTSTGAGGEAVVTLERDGVAIVQGEREIGSGSVVGGLADVAGRVLGLPPEAVRVDYRDTSKAPYDSGVYGSRTVGALGGAVADAANHLLKDLASRLRSKAPVKLLWRDGRLWAQAGRERRRVEELFTPAERTAGGITAGGRHYGKSPPIDESKVVDGTFYPYTDFTGTVSLVEVRVDRETGQVTPVRVAAFPDVGVALNRASIAGQVEGAVAMGLGTALTEEMLWNPDGRLLNPTLVDYRIPTLGEVPPIETHPVEGFLGAGPFGAKGVGEPPMIPVAAAVANAVADATGARVTELPLQAERVARALKLL